MFVCFLAVVKKDLSQNVFDCLNYEIYTRMFYVCNTELLKY